MQVIADVTGRRVEAVAHPLEAGAVGMGLVAAVGLGLYPDMAALKGVVQVQRIFEPQRENAGIYKRLFETYKQVYKSLRRLYRTVNKERFERKRNDS